MQYNEQLDLLRVSWHGGPNMSHFRSSSLLLVALARRLSIRRCLLDMDSLPDISAYDQIWMGLHWMPGVLRLPMREVVFTIQPRRVYHQLAIDSLLALARPFMKFGVHYFDETRPALRWLTDDSAHLPALLAEWDARPLPELPAPLPLTNPPRHRRLPI